MYIFVPSFQFPEWNMQTYFNMWKLKGGGICALPTSRGREKGEQAKVNCHAVINFAKGKGRLYV